MSEQNNGTYTFEIDREKFSVLTEQEKQLVTYWRSELFTTLCTPSYSDMGRKLGVSKSKVSSLLKSLSSKGFNLREEKNAISLDTLLSDNPVKAIITICDPASKNAPIIAKPLIREKSATEKVLEILDAKEAKGAFIFHDLFNNREKYGFNFKSQHRMYEICQTLEKQGFVKIVSLYNQNSKNTNKLQAYVQKVKF